MSTKNRLALWTLLGLLFAGTSLANPITVTHFTKAADASTPYPGGGAGVFVDSTMFYPDGDGNEIPSLPSLSNDGRYVSFITCATSACWPNALSYDSSTTALDSSIPPSVAATVDFKVSRDGDYVGVLDLINIFSGPVAPRLFDWSMDAQIAADGITATDISVDGPEMAYLTSVSSNDVIRVRDIAGFTDVATGGNAVPDTAPGAFFVDFFGPDLSDGNVVFTGVDLLGNFAFRGIYTDSPHCPGCAPAGLNKVHRKDDPAPLGAGSTFEFFRDEPAMDGNQIVFVANGEIPGPAPFEGIFLTDASGTTMIVDYLGLGINGTDFVDIANGTVAYGIAESEIRLWNDGDTTTVLQSGDPLDGKIVSKIRIVRDALADNSLAFPVEFTDGSEAIYIAHFTVAAQSVPIDVQPIAPATALHPHHDGGPGAVNGLNDLIEVTVFGQSTAAGDPQDFVANTVDFGSLEFGPALGAPAPGSGPIFNTDFDSDGIDDAQFLFQTGDVGIQCSDTTATLLGETTANSPFEGTDTITTDCGALCHN